MPKAVLRREVGHCRRVRRGLAQCPPRQIKAAEHQITLWPHPQLLLATHLQGPVGDSDHLTNFGDIKGLRRVFLQYPAKPAHDDRMVSLSNSVLTGCSLVEAPYQGLDQRLLETARGFGMGNDLRGVFRQL